MEKRSIRFNFVIRFRTPWNPNHRRFNSEALIALAYINDTNNACPNEIIMLAQSYTIINDKNGCLGMANKIYQWHF